ncbi:hypothetical protein DFH09DRAFT_1086203 [Mycena vulgaris]|nr:hypothetical protein DFH09DRAFT_1086203 [Mycena vulgaris]
MNILGAKSVALLEIDLLSQGLSDSNGFQTSSEACYADWGECVHPASNSTRPSRRSPSPGTIFNIIYGPVNSSRSIALSPSPRHVGCAVGLDGSDDGLKEIEARQGRIAVCFLSPGPDSTSSELKDEVGYGKLSSINTGRARPCVRIGVKWAQSCRRNCANHLDND